MTINYKVFAAGDTLSANDLLDYIENQTVVQVDTEAELATLYANHPEVKVAFAEDTDKIYVLNDGTWDPLVSGSSPTLTNLTLTGDLTVQGTTTTIDSTTIAVKDKFVFEGATNDAHETTLQVAEPTADRTVTIPDATTTLVGTDATQTLTNKTISGADNTLTVRLDQSDVTGTLASTKGGTGLSSFTTGDMIYSSSGNTLNKLGIGSSGQVLTVASGIPSWAAAAGGSSFSGARLTKSVGQTLTNNTDTMITWDVETFDVGNYHDNVTNNTRITIPAGKAGYYQVSAILSYAAGGTGQRIIQLAKNGATFSYNLIVENGLGGGGYQTVTFADIVYGAVGDYFEIAGLHSQGHNLNIIGNNGDPGASFFAMSYIGA